MKVKEVMNTKPIVVKVPGTRHDVLKLLVKHKRTGMPVVDSKGNLAGLVTRQNIFDTPNEEQLAVIMSWDPPTVSPDDPIEDAARCMGMGEERLHHVPVVKGKKLVGIVAPSDLLSIIEKRNIEGPVENYIQGPCIPIYDQMPITIAAEIMSITNSYALPVLDKNARLAGIITDRDLFNLGYVDKTTALTELGLGEDEDTWTWGGLRNIMKLYYEVSKVNLPSISVSAVMVKSPLTVFKKTSIAVAAREMVRNDFGQIPVRDSNDRLIGMLLDIDAIVALYE